MTLFNKFDCLAAGLAIFAMFFGAGNIIFPLALGLQTLDQTPWGLFGLLLTSVMMPIAGLFAMFRHKGQITLFFGRLGKIPGYIIALITIILIGPFGGAPRCVALSYSTLASFFPNISLIAYSAMACFVIFLFTYRENRLLKVLGYFLSPLMVIFLIWILFKGFVNMPETLISSTNSSEISHFCQGLLEGYNTMDLLAAFFFAPLIISSLGSLEEKKKLNTFVLKACAIGAFLLAIIYIGFCYLAYFHASQLEGISKELLLGAIAIKILGSCAGLMVILTVTFACLTTAIALIAAFANFMQKEILGEKIGYIPVLLISLLITFAVTTLEFQGIANFLSPILKFCYPALIGLTIINLFWPPKVTPVKVG